MATVAEHFCCGAILLRRCLVADHFCLVRSHRSHHQLCLLTLCWSRDTAFADVIGASLNVIMDDLATMKFTGKAVHIICELDPTYVEYVVIEKGQKVIYVCLHKAFHGCVRSALLWYKLFSETLSEMAFVLNNYDQCIANSTIDGAQCTVAWYVDGTKNTNF